MARLVEGSSGITGADISLFYSVTTKIAGTLSVAHGLARTPTVVLVEPNTAAAGNVVTGTHDGTSLVINNLSTGASVRMFAM